MGKNMEVLEFLATIAICVAVFSAFKMQCYLYKRGKVKSLFYSFNPLFFLEYVELSRSETGNIGIWFKVATISFCVSILSIIVLIVLLTS